jgi:hypothetical protein
VNKTLYNRKAKLPETLIKHLEQSFSALKSDSNTEGHNRNKELRENGFVTYQQLKRMKNWFDTYSGKKEDAPFILNGGDRMNRWCDHVLDHWRNTLESGKQTKHDSGMSNQFIRNHEKKNSIVNPHDRHEKGINKFDTTVTENIKKINQIMQTIL